jgi:hypothetical protein
VPATADQRATTAGEGGFHLGPPFTRIAYGNDTRVCQLAMRFKGQVDESESYSFKVTFQLKPAGEQWPNRGLGGLLGGLVANRPNGRFVIVPVLDLYGSRVGKRRVTYQRRTWRYLATRSWVRVRMRGWIRTDERRVWSGARTYRASTRAMRRCTLGR